jgi:hypothetical protein
MGSPSVIDMTPPDKPYVAATRPSTRATGRKTPRLVTVLAAFCEYGATSGRPSRKVQQQKPS